MDFKCEYCGKEFNGGNPSLIYRFCSKSCAARAKFDGQYDKSLDWKRVDGKWQCPYNEGATCRSRVCERCGWNPKVAQKRTEKIMGAFA